MKSIFLLTALSLSVNAVDNDATDAGQAGVACGKGLPPCTGNTFCRKLDSACIDLKNEGNCIGTCTAKSLGNFNGAIGGNGAPVQQPPRNAGGLFGGALNNGPLGALTAPKSSNPLSSALGNLVVQPITIQQCPSSVRCRRNEVCVPHPMIGNAYLCVSGDEVCGTWLNKRCSVGKKCLADPRYTCDRNGTCSGRDGVCVVPPTTLPAQLPSNNAPYSGPPPQQYPPQQYPPQQYPPQQYPPQQYPPQQNGGQYNSPAPYNGPGGYYPGSGRRPS